MFNYIRLNLKYLLLFFLFFYCFVIGKVVGVIQFYNSINKLNFIINDVGRGHSPVHRDREQI